MAIRWRRLLFAFSICFVACVLLTPLLLLRLISSSIDDHTATGNVDHLRVGAISFSDDDDLFEMSLADRKKYVDGVRDLMRIRESVRAELLQMEAKRNDFRKEIQELTDYLNKQIPARQWELTSLESRINESTLLLQELDERRTPVVRLPHEPLFFTTDHQLPSVGTSIACTLQSCFDRRRCSITTHMPIYVYPLPATTSRSELAQLYYEQLLASEHRSSDAAHACLFMVIVDNGKLDSSRYEYWRRDGWNHVIIDLTGNVTFNESINAIIVSTQFRIYRHKFDIVSPIHVGRDDDWRQFAPLLPYSREFLVYFETNINTDNRRNSVLIDEMFNFVQSTNTTEDAFHLIANCSSPTVHFDDLFPLCDSSQHRRSLLRRSLFALIPTIHASSSAFLQRLFEALFEGAIPIIVGSGELPLSDLIDWNLLSYHIDFEQLPELHFALRSINIDDLLEMRRRGRIVTENYFVNVKVLSRTILSAIRYRLKLPAIAILDYQPSSAFNGTFTAPLLEPVKLTSNEESDEYLGPIEAPYPSPTYRYNFSWTNQYSYSIWNEYNYVGLHNQLPTSPLNRPIMPTEAEMLSDSKFGFRPINQGMGGSGKEFSEAIGGNDQREQFTVVMLTYERDAVLVSALERLNRLPYLNKVIVVWNNIGRPPAADTAWPKLHVPVLFVNVSHNSLNNRFLPFKEIETEAVLSMDDDVHLAQHEIIFAFRVWREQRAKLVGFPARYHSWYDGRWHYNSNHSCQLSMILTGAAFFHKFYSYAYTYTMSADIRDKVDQLINCEDIAMNFLVAHLTRQPPVKTTSRWTFRCPGCPETLSNDENYFAERNECMQFFTKVYGYNPLLFTQFRVDSVLFKTRLPHQHQKCFKYV